MATDPTHPDNTSALDEFLAQVEQHEQERAAEQRLSKPQPRRKATVSSVLGELLITAGVLVFGFIIWQPLWSATVVQGEQIASSQNIRSQWSATPAPEPTAFDGDIPIPNKVANGEAIGVLYVPAFGENFQVAIGESTDMATVLNSPTFGVGHYEQTQLPGQLGNVVLAGHRSGWTPTAFREIMNFRLNDPIFIETPQGWYTYRFRSLEYVSPDAGEVLNAFPHQVGVSITDRLLTFTTCHPKLSGSDERAISYAVFDSYQPLSDGPPAELKALNTNVKG